MADYKEKGSETGGDILAAAAPNKAEDYAICIADKGFHGKNDPWHCIKCGKLMTEKDLNRVCPGKQKQAEGNK